MTAPKSCKYVIQSMTESGRQFRPSDWIDRISSLDAEYGLQHRLIYSDNLHPELFEGKRSLIIDMSLKESNVGLFDFVMDFVKANQLKMVKVCMIAGEYVATPHAEREQAQRESAQYALNRA